MAWKLCLLQHYHKLQKLMAKEIQKIFNPNKNIGKNLSILNLQKSIRNSLWKDVLTWGHYDPENYDIC